MKSTDSPDLSKFEPEIDVQVEEAFDPFLMFLLAAQGLIWFLVGLSLGWWAWG